MLLQCSWYCASSICLLTLSQKLNFLPLARFMVRLQYMSQSDGRIIPYSLRMGSDYRLIGPPSSISPSSATSAEISWAFASQPWASSDPNLFRTGTLVKPTGIKTTRWRNDLCFISHNKSFTHQDSFYVPCLLEQPQLNSQENSNLSSKTELVHSYSWSKE